ncbi:MAG: DUF2071 domain-containing protein [Planctomycetota bacterium]|nr:DUF2071 domain-containing protein [Planctomycetota bacterium]
MLLMRWEDLLFLHWAVEPDALRRFLPAGLELDTFDGRAWLGVVPFTMAATRFRCLPPVPTANRFPELNLRTYVRCGDRAGVWFFSLDAHSRLAVEGARVGFGLPYFFAEMQSRREGARVSYKSRRVDRRGPPAGFEGAWRPVGPWQAAVPGSLEHFLVERYSLFAVRRGRLLRGDVVHPPWRLAAADVALEVCDATRLVDLELDGAPCSALAAQPVLVRAAKPFAV